MTLRRSTLAALAAVATLAVPLAFAGASPAAAQEVTVDQLIGQLMAGDEGVLLIFRHDYRQEAQRLGVANNIAIPAGSTFILRTNAQLTVEYWTDATRTRAAQLYCALYGPDYHGCEIRSP